MEEVILAFDNVSKRYGGNEVLTGACLSAARGKCVALTGRNGSGKTTLLKLAAGLALPTSGAVRRDARIRTQYIPEAFPPLNISARSVLRSLGRAEGIPGERLETVIRELLGEFSLDRESGMPLRAYSKGMLQKVSVIQAFLSQPDLLLLDEPLSGQDAQSQAAFVRRARACKAAGAAIILACHERHLISALADSVYEVREGRLEETVMPEESGMDRYVFALPDDTSALPQLPSGPGILAEYGDGSLTVSVPHGTGGGMLREMLEAGCRLMEMRYEKNP